ncbi:uncharacterized protein FFB20_06307 [Fusarium fujikuroi]|uniref:Uncharacterized protein n=1 Tax=Fusarium fujikuroi TaxID=5127 RepID=A0A2H3RQ98_FUSFU|nr:uncharacterized protein Y057_13439 [Fusarium fujikuroi]KLP15498.1 uncharacterized protein LW94_5270 [Fusarium fujikuroi]QGI62865.1 hypothetical protein CEK27_006836 [Fusarium fujikuroi]QGI80034.1 hypothetical protein CEK25_006763 [Fusarium fujikuroi]QGI93750.1 hypothetical protein CEK26_006819 [Fusarium fujikuroi]
MPITVTIPNSKASSWQHPKAENTSQLLRGASSQEADGCKQIIQSSFSINGSLEENHVSASRNGLVWSSFYAYSTHHHLTIRPEDVWFAIITQLSTYINANSEKMRGYFVSHDGQKRLEVIDFATLHTADYGNLSQKMTLEIAKNIKDPAFLEWILPSFSTTTDNDRVVGSVLLMGALQKYFSYAFGMECGIPSVTLLGEITDYEDILNRLDRLDEMGEEPIQFAMLLRPIIRNMVLTFTQPYDPAIHIFWNQIVNIHEMSGSKTMTGWITAFCYWDDEGKAGLSSPGNGTLGDLMYLHVDTDDIPCGYVTVPVEVNDNGTLYNCKMLAGSVGMQAVPGPEGYVPAFDPFEDRRRNVELDETKLGIKPVTGWMIYEVAQQNQSYNQWPIEVDIPMVEIVTND